MKNILILNRRCIRHPERGGAEVYTFELAKAIIEQGALVEWFSSKPKTLQKKEEIEGLKFIRKGNELTTHFWGFIYALKKKDWLIIDEFNGIGFFTFCMKNSIVLIHQLYDDIWTAGLGLKGYPLKFIEKILLGFYKKKATITGSNSTDEDLRQFGFDDIAIIHNGIDILPLDHIPEKEKKLTLIFLGRLKNTKNPQDAVKAFLLVQKEINDAQLWIVGEGPLGEYLRREYEKLEGIHFWGFVSDQKKYELLKKAHFLLIPSIREGWGQVVIQANAVGTPTIGYNVKGLKDSIKNEETGFLVNDYQAMSLKAIELWNNEEKYQNISRNALKWSTHFSWEKTQKDFILFLEKRGIC